MKKSFTPGPWRVRKHWSDDGCYEVYPVRGKSPGVGQWSEVCDVRDSLGKGESARANAALIAAAPLMLDVLQKIIESVPFTSMHWRTRNEVIDAVRAATGEQP